MTSVARCRSFAAGELEALLADPGEELTAATKSRIDAARQGLALLHFLFLILKYISF